MILKRGHKGTGVLDLQNRLKYIGYEIETDGDFGPATEKMVIKFQETHGLKPDGIVGDKTMEAISELYYKHIKYESAGNHREEKGVMVVNFNTGPIFLLDNGHGGMINGVYQTAGKRSPEVPPGVYEGVANRNIVNRLIDYCEDNRISYVNLVPEQEDVSLGERVRRANNIQSIYGNTVYVSIHCNAAGSGWNSANGIETFYRSANSNKMAEIFQQCLIEETGRRDRGAKEANFYVLRKTTMPAILSENGFMTNREEAMLLDNEVFIDKIAYAHARAMKKITKL